VKVSNRTGEKSLTQKEYQKLLAVCNTLEEEVLLKLSVGLGLRRRDVASVKIANIDLTEGKVTYYEHKKDRDRTVPLGPDLTQLLRKYVSTLSKNQAFLFNGERGNMGIEQHTGDLRPCVTVLEYHGDHFTH
jgi:integrase